MSLHFLLKAEARTLSMVQVLAMSDDDAFALFRHLRWGEGKEVVCPHCGMAHRHYFRPTRKIWRCAGCQEDFSVTSGTIFAFHKLPLRLYLAAAILFANGQAAAAVATLRAALTRGDLGENARLAWLMLLVGVAWVDGSPRTVRASWVVVVTWLAPPPGRPGCRSSMRRNSSRPGAFP